MRVIFVSLLLPGLAGCSTLSAGGSPGSDSAGNEIKTVIPNKTLNVSKSLRIPLEGLVLGAAIYLVVDPLSPNWQIEETRISKDDFRIALRRKPFASGGDGEAGQVFQRRAEQIARENGYSGYTIIEFTEGIESTLPVARRVSHGTIRLK
ncbi:MAG: hypothetical protein K2Y16_14800 [Burkholderiales bacterium]|nr:hypothetical protein [Burkholderiales bacterium]